MSGPGDSRPALLFWRYAVAKEFRDPLSPTPLEEYLNDLGHECPNPVPVAPPVGFVKQPSMVEHMRSMVRDELLRRELVSQGVESFEESDDFEIEDDPIDPSTPYEEVFDPPPAGEDQTRTPPVGGAADAVTPASPAAVVVPPAAPPPRLWQPLLLLLLPLSRSKLPVHSLDVYCAR